MNQKEQAFTKLLLEENTRQNLTRITDPSEIAAKHFADSLTLLKHLPQKGKIIDVGTGAGFPAVPLAIANENLEITALDSLNKRIDFLKSAKQQLKLDNFHPLHARAELLAQTKEYREQFDACVSRAVANLAALCEYCLPFVKIGGLFIAMKGKTADEETAEAAFAIKTLGGTLKQTIPYTLPGIDNHCLVIIEKTKATPANFPRQRVNISKNPLHPTT
jgi:16S rRNA (guanine(527)-N(7))-methyltransferase GidB